MVVAALTADADQPSLHALLGDLYARTGLPREADEAYEPRAGYAVGRQALPGTR